MNHELEPDKPMPQVPLPAAPEHPPVVYGDNHGIISTGNWATNIILGTSGFEQTPSLRQLPLHEAPEMASEPVRLFGRDAIVDQVCGQMLDGNSVQLYGRAGVGKKAISDAVRSRLAAERRRGHLLLPAMGETASLQAVYRSLAGLFFQRHFLRDIKESELREAVSRVQDVFIAIYDCALSREDVTHLLRTFEGCTFLLTSPYRTLPDSAAVHHIQPLTRQAAVELFSAELGLELGPVGLRELQFDHALEKTEGSPQRLKQYAEFIKGSDDWHERAAAVPLEAHAELEDSPGHGPPPTDALRVHPLYQAESLAIRLGEPARQLLVSLATFDVPLRSDWFGPLTGISQATAAGRELHDRRLVTRRGKYIAVTEDAATAVRSLGWPPADSATAAEGVLSALATPSGAVDPDTDLLLSLARALDKDRHWALAARFDRTVLPIALRVGRKQTALELSVLGRRAAVKGDLTTEVQYWVRTGEPLQTVLTGDQRAATAALLVGGLLLDQRTTRLVTVPGARSTGTHNMRRLLNAGRGAKTVAAVAVVTSVLVGAGFGINALTSGDPQPQVTRSQPTATSATLPTVRFPRLNGSQLTAFLLPPSMFTAGTTAGDPDESPSDFHGVSVGSLAFKDYICTPNLQLFSWNTNSYASRTGENIEGNTYFSQEVSMYVDDATASSYFSKIPDQIAQCAAESFSELQVPNVKQTKIAGHLAYVVPHPYHSEARAVIVLYGSFILSSHVGAVRDDGPVLGDPTPERVAAALVSSVASSAR
ncbi:hypothetical protein OG241_06425 [Streptomyces sp. NBC_01390]|uniref:hypothetical protein n=1 Tax=Streptomyces sp. NBC_01390 TaxID=2903850 RepID=UPI0032483A77